MSYKFLPHTADVLFEVKDKTIEKLFIDSAKALNAAQVELKTLEKKKKRKITLESQNLEMLLFDFLQELVFIKDVEQLLFKDFDVKIETIKTIKTIKTQGELHEKLQEKQEKVQGKLQGKCKLEAICYGDKINPKKQTLLSDVKAITLEEFKLWEEKGIWRARVLVDV